MKAMLAGFAAIILITIVAKNGLAEIGYSSQERYSSDSVRLD